MNINEITDKLEAAGCTVAVWKNQRVYVKATPNGGRKDFGFCVEADDVRDITKDISTRRGEISEYLRA